MKATIDNKLLQIGMGNRYNGGYKYLTKNCPPCRFYVLVDEHERCYWGVAWKFLVSAEKPRMCQFYDKASPREEIYLGIKQRKAGLESCLGNAPLIDSKITSGYMDVIGRWEKI